MKNILETGAGCLRGTLSCVPALLFLSVSALGAGYPVCPGYANSITFTYDPSGAALGGSLSGFPQMFYITDARLKTTANGGNIANPNAWDMCVSSSNDQASYPFQIASYDGTAGKLWFYFRPATTPTTATAYNLWVGAVTVVNPSSTAVWAGNYGRVMLLQETGTPNGAGSGIYLDKTSTGANSSGGTNPTKVSGLIGNAQSFNSASSEWIAVKAAIGSGAQTIQFTANPSASAPAANYLWDGRPIGCGGQGGAMTVQAGTGFLKCYNGTNSATGTTDVRGTTHVLACQYATGVTTPYVDGVAQGTGATNTPSAESVNAEVGKACDSSLFYSGTLQNFESSIGSFSADWLKLEAYQTLNAAAVVTLGAVTAKPIITSFACSPATVTMLTATTCTGTSVNATTNLIAGGGDSSASTSGTFTPDFNTFYSMTSCNAAGCSQSTFSVVVNAIGATGNNPVLSAVSCTPYSDSVQCTATSDTVSQFTVLCGTSANGGGSATPTGNTWATGTLWPLTSTADGAASAGSWGRVHLKNSAVVIGGPNASHGLALFCVVQATNAHGGPTNSTQQSVSTLAATVTTPFRWNSTNPVIPYTRPNSQYNGSEGMPNNGFWIDGDTEYITMGDDGNFYGKSSDTGGVNNLSLNNGTVGVFNWSDGKILTATQPLGVNVLFADSTFVADGLDVTARDGCMYMFLVARTVAVSGQVKSCDHWITSLWSSNNLGPNTAPNAGLDLTKHVATITSSSGDGTIMTLTFSGGWGGFPPPVNKLMQINGGACNGRWAATSSDATHVTFLSSIVASCSGVAVTWFPAMFDVPFVLSGIGCAGTTGCPPVQGMDAFQYYTSAADASPGGWLRVRREYLPLQRHTDYQCFAGTYGAVADWLNDAKWVTVAAFGSSPARNASPCTNPTGGPWGQLGWYKQHTDFIPSFNRFQLTAYWDQATSPGGGMGNGTPFWDVGDTPSGTIGTPVGQITPDLFRNPGMTPGFPNCIAGTWVQDSSAPLSGHQTCVVSGGPNKGPQTGGDRSNYTISTFQVPYVDASSPKRQRALTSFSGGRGLHIANGLQYFANFKDPAFGLRIADISGHWTTTVGSGKPLMDQYGMILGPQAEDTNTTDAITWTNRENYLVTTALTSNIGAAFSSAVCFGHAPYTLNVFGQGSVTVNPIVSGEVVANYGSTFNIVRHLATSAWDVTVRGTTIGAITITEGSFGCIMIVSTGTGANGVTVYRSDDAYNTPSLTGTAATAAASGTLSAGDFTASLHGHLSNVLIWNRALSPAEVQREFAVLGADMLSRDPSYGTARIAAY